MVSRYRKTFSLVLLMFWLVPGVTGALHGQESPVASPEAAVPIRRHPADADAALPGTTTISDAPDSGEGPDIVISTTLDVANSETPANPPSLEEILMQWDRIRTAHLPQHIWYRETIRIGNIREARLLQEQGYPEGRTHVSEVELAIYDGRRWRRPLSCTVDGKPTKSLTREISGTPHKVEPETVLYGFLLNPYPKDSSLSFDGPYAHITAPAEYPFDKIDIWLMPTSGWWVPKECKLTMSEDYDEDESLRIESFEWEVKHLKVFGKDHPPRIINGEHRMNVRTRDAKFTTMTEFEITRALYGRDVVPEEIDPSLAAAATPAPPATDFSSDSQRTPQPSSAAKIIVIETTPDIERSEVIRKVVEALEKDGIAKRGAIERIGKPIAFEASMAPHRDLPYQKTMELVKTLKSLGINRMCFRVNRNLTDEESSVTVQCPADVAWRRVQTITDELDKLGDFKVDVRVAASDEPVTPAVADSDSFGVSEPQLPRRVPSRTEITVYESMADNDSVRKANAFIRNVSALTEISFEDWNPDTIDRSVPLLTIVCHTEPDRERIIALLNGIKELRIPAVRILFRIVGGGKAKDDVVIIENSTLLDKPKLKPLWDYLKALPDFGIHVPANTMFNKAIKARRHAHDPVGPPASMSISDSTEGPATSIEVKVFRLKYADAKSVARIIEQLYGTKYSIAVDDRTNSVIYDRSAEGAQTIEALLITLDEPIPTDPHGKTSGTAVDARRTQGPAPVEFDGAYESLRGFDFRGVTSEDSTVFRFSIGHDGEGESLDQLRKQYNDLEQRAVELARRLRARLPDPAIGDRLERELRTVVTEAFAARQKLQRAELAEFAQRLKGIQQSIELRDRIGQQVIERRVEELLDPNLQWDNSRAAHSGSMESKGPVRTSVDHDVDIDITVEEVPLEKTLWHVTGATYRTTSDVPDRLLIASVGDQNAASADQWLEVTQLRDQGPSQVAGLAVGDVVLAIDHNPIHSLRDFHRAWQDSEYGGPALVTFVRHGDVSLARIRWSYASLSPYNAEGKILRREGDKVTLSLGQNHGLHPGDQIAIRSFGNSIFHTAEVLVVQSERSVARITTEETRLPVRADDHAYFGPVPLADPPDLRESIGNPLNPTAEDTSPRDAQTEPVDSTYDPL